MGAKAGDHGGGEGGGGEASRRTPQSVQSEPNAQWLVSEAAPPSSHSPSPAYLNRVRHTVRVRSRGPDQSPLLWFGPAELTLTPTLTTNSDPAPAPPTPKPVGSVVGSVPACLAAQLAWEARRRRRGQGEGGGVVQGRRGARQRRGGRRRARGEDLRAEAREVLHDRLQVAVRGRVRGRGRGLCVALRLLDYGTFEVNARHGQLNSRRSIP